MAALTSEQLAWATARLGVARLGTARLGAAARSFELKADGSGEIIWDRPVAKDGDPDDTAANWTTGKE